MVSIEIIKKNPEALAKRVYFEAKIVFTGKTPSRIEIRKDLCHTLGSKEATTIIREIKTDYGSERAVIKGYVYDSEDLIKEFESKHIILRHLPKAEQVAEKEKIKAAKQAIKAAAQAAKKKK